MFEKTDLFVKTSKNPRAAHNIARQTWIGHGRNFAEIRLQTTAVFKYKLQKPLPQHLDSITETGICTHAAGAVSVRGESY